MKSLFPLLQIELNFSDYKFGLLCFVTAFVVSMVAIPPIIMLANKYQLHDKPGLRKEHSMPTPTLGGIAILGGMVISLLFWFPHSISTEIIVSLFSISLLFAMGITDDIKDLPAKYKFIVEVALATLIALSNIRITTFGGLFGLYELPLSAQYTFTIFAIVGITNAFNLIDGIDGLAGGISFMSLVILGIFLTVTGDKNFALIAFALAGGVLAFLYFNMNPAKIFMGDTGSLILGFVIAILCTRLIQSNHAAGQLYLKNTPLFAFGIVLIPVYDAMRVFALRIWKGQSPFTADKTHIHHLLTGAGLDHSLSAKVISVMHAFVLMEVYWLNDMKPLLILLILLATMALLTFLCINFHRYKKQKPESTNKLFTS
jgi:UDP-N-acetylmuramyl pentapeptide phosphotransferase/UDP-N-acetylglucosamine-1-phosphate transferase